MEESHIVMGLVVGSNLEKAGYYSLYTNASAPREMVVDGGDNLVFFKWAVPSGTAGLTFKLTATVDPANRIDVVHRNNQVFTVNRTISAAVSSVTPDTQYESKMPVGYSKTDIPARTSYTSNSWSVWEYYIVTTNT